MAVMMPREKWTDEKLDELQAEMREGFAEAKAETREGFARIEGDVKRIDGDVKRLDSKIDRLDGNLGEIQREMNARFEGLYRTLQACTVAIIVALIGSNAL